MLPMKVRALGLKVALTVKLMQVCFEHLGGKIAGVSSCWALHCAFLHRMTYMLWIPWSYPLQTPST